MLSRVFLAACGFLETLILLRRAFTTVEDLPVKASARLGLDFQPAAVDKMVWGMGMVDLTVTCNAIVGVASLIKRDVSSLSHIHVSVVQSAESMYMSVHMRTTIVKERSCANPVV